MKGGSTSEADAKARDDREQVEAKDARGVMKQGPDCSRIGLCRLAAANARERASVERLNEEQ